MLLGKLITLTLPLIPGRIIAELVKGWVYFPEYIYAVWAQKNLNTFLS